MTTFEDLPFGKIWCVDTEFYPGAGLAHGGRRGDPVSPLCLVAIEARSGQTIRLWQDEFGRCPPYGIGANSLFVSYAACAELGVHLALGWGEPASVLDLLVEFRHHTNDARVKGGDRALPAERCIISASI